VARKTPAQRASAKAYRQTDKGRLARKYYMMRPEVKMRNTIRRAVKKKLAGHS
jgi:hypothetical protein